MMENDTDNSLDVLDLCIEQLSQGKSVTDCLSAYPDRREELAPLLLVAEQVRRFEPPVLSRTARQAIQRRMLTAVPARRLPASSGLAWLRAPLLRFALALCVIVLALGGGVVAAHSSLPGEPLYRIKRMAEQVQMGLTLDPQRRAALCLDFANERFVETQALLRQRRPLDPQLIDELTQEYQAAWLAIERLPAAESAALRTRYIAARQSEIDLLSDSLGHSSAADHPLLERAVRLGQAALDGVVPAASPTRVPSSPLSSPVPTQPRAPLPAPSSTAVLAPSPIATSRPAPTPAPVELPPTAVPVEASPTPGLVELPTTPAPVEASATPAPVEASATPPPVEVTPIVGPEKTPKPTKEKEKTPKPTKEKEKTPKSNEKGK